MKKYDNLQKRAIDTIQKNIEIGEHYIWGNKRCIVPSRGPYLGAWNWDSAFHANTVSRWDPELAYEQIEIFLDVQCDDGKLPDAIFGWDNTVFTRITKPPVMPWAFTNVYKRDPSNEKLIRAYDSFVRNEAFWVNKRCENGLFHYDCDVNDEDYVKYSAYESGWDTSVRFDGGAYKLWAVDLNCYMVMFYEAMIFMANELKKTDEVKIWKEKKDLLISLINEKLWDDVEKCYYDYDYTNGCFSKVLTPASFMPLYVGIATKERAEFLHQLATNEDKLYPGFPTVAYDHSAYDGNDYWRGPTWLNVAFFAAKGLYDYGYKETALKIKETILDICNNEKRSIFEYYNSKSGEGRGAEGFSWSSCFIIEFIEEIK